MYVFQKITFTYNRHTKKYWRQYKKFDEQKYYSGHTPKFLNISLKDNIDNSIHVNACGFFLRQICKEFGGHDYRLQ